jgi:hypothetical protein
MKNKGSLTQNTSPQMTILSRKTLTLGPLYVNINIMRLGETDA